MMTKKHTVEVLESFEHTVQLGALTITGAGGGTETIAAPEVKTFRHLVGARYQFTRKDEAMAFCEVHGARVRYLGKI